jgi:hypothetical protein
MWLFRVFDHKRLKILIKPVVLGSLRASVSQLSRAKGRGVIANRFVDMAPV